MTDEIRRVDLREGHAGPDVTRLDLRRANRDRAAPVRVEHRPARQNDQLRRRIAARLDRIARRCGH